MKSKILCFVALFLVTAYAYAQKTIFPYSSEWKYLDDGTDPGAGWQLSSYNDDSWTAGTSMFGFGDRLPVITCIKPGPACGANSCVPSPTFCGKYITYYFRKKVMLSNVSSHPDFRINMVRDDGAVVYVNGVEVWRTNMPAGAITNSTLASTSAAETIVYTTTIPASSFIEGENLIAVEVHQNAGNSPDLLFNMELVANDPVLIRGPYLQMANENAITVRWRTSAPVESRLEVGTTYGSYTLQTVIEVTPKTEHQVRVIGLSADTKYFYRIGSANDIIRQEPEMYFRTAPPASATRKIGIAVFGDCGRDDNAFRTGSINSYKNHVGSNPAELMLLLGDNAYNSGTDEEYTINFFNPFAPELLKNHALFPTPGNHDYGSTSRTSRSGAYYQSFTIPANGECGGVPSGTEAYYSFNWGDIHFISLDSYGHEAGSTRLYDTLGPQVEWVKADLAANTRKWVIAYWHHPPFTMGSHNSDAEQELINIRSNFIRILERNGVDLVLCGHSHDYERSYLIKGHYGNETTFDKRTHAVDSSSAKYDGTALSCPYITSSFNPDHGTVYVVSGSSGADGQVQAAYPHNAMPFSFDDGGMLYLEVEGNRLDAKFLRRDNTIADQFTIMQDVGINQTVTTTVGQPATIEASWIGNYEWSTGQTSTKSITVTPASAGQQVISVKDNLSQPCITDEITLNVASALPVTLLEFSAERKSNHVLISWRTAEEVNNRKYIIERSTDGRTFSAIADVAPVAAISGTRRYNFRDVNPPAGETYYRLAQMDTDNRVTYLKTVVVRASDKEVKMSVENPSSTPGAIRVTLSSPSKQNLPVLVHDSIGATIFSKQYEVTSVNSTVVVQVPSAGSYVVSVRTASGKKISRRVVVN